MQTEVLTDRYVKICSASIQGNVARRDIALKHKRSVMPRFSQANSFGGTNGGTNKNQTTQYSLKTMILIIKCDSCDRQNSSTAIRERLKNLYFQHT